MKFRAEIDIMPLKELLDPQGKAVTSGLRNIGIQEITDVRIGKHITLEVEAPSKEVAEAKVDAACKKLLATAFIHTNNCIIQKMPLYVVLSGWPMAR